MKKIYSFLLLMLCVSATAFAGNAKCLLHHNGAVTLYDSDDINAALTAAVAGDTLFLSEGSFAGFTITKKITVRGSGQFTKVGGEITINIPDNPTLTSALIEGIYCNSDLKIAGAVNGLQIKQSVFNNIYPLANINNAFFDKIFVTGTLHLNKYVLGLTSNNSKYYQIYHQTHIDNDYNCHIVSNASIYFVNCNIRSINEYNGNALQYVNFTNCILNDFSYPLKFCSITYCLYTKYYGLKYDEVSTSVEHNYNHNMDNDYTNGSNRLMNDMAECPYDAATLVSKGFIGNDGTAVGCLGGSTPYTLVLAGPKVTESSIQLDNENKQLSVTLKVTAK